GYLSVDMERYGALRLQEKSRPLLRGEEQLALRKDSTPAAGARQKTRQALPEDVDVALWEALRECRRQLAEEQSIPPYIIFHDSTLQAMCLQRPQSLAAFGELPGVGARKQEKYGSAFLQVISNATT
ncbi:MAG: HRDC domain-containing protein, partial [Chromatocurvus sp.]